MRTISGIVALISAVALSFNVNAQTLTPLESDYTSFISRLWQFTQQPNSPVYVGFRFYKPAEMYALYPTGVLENFNFSYNAIQTKPVAGVLGSLGYQISETGSVFVNMSYDKSQDFDSKRLKIGWQKTF